MLVGLGHLALDLAPVEPVPYWGGAQLARKLGALRALDRAEGVEVIAVGSSFVDTGFSARRHTELTGDTAFNLGLGGSDMVLQARLIRDVLIPEFEPETIVWGLGDSLRNLRASNHQMLSSPGIRHLADWHAPLVPLERRLAHHQRRRAGEWLALLTNGDPDGDEENRFGDTSKEFRADAGGAETRRVPEFEDGPDEEPANADAQRSSGRRRGPRMRRDHSVTLAEAEALFVETLDLARARGVEVRLYVAPYFATTFRPAATATRRMVDNGPFHDWLCRVFEERGLRLANLRHCAEISGEPRYFYDTTHLNRWGSPVLTTLLAQLFHPEGRIPERWSDLPSAAQVEAVFGAVDAGSAPVIETGTPVELSTLLRGSGAADGAHARVRIPRAGTYRLVLLDGEAGDGAFAARLGRGGFRALTENPAEFTLEAGMHRLELYALGKQPLPWRALEVR